MRCRPSSEERKVWTCRNQARRREGYRGRSKDSERHGEEDRCRQDEKSFLPNGPDGNGRLCLHSQGRNPCRSDRLPEKLTSFRCRKKAGHSLFAFFPIFSTMDFATICSCSSFKGICPMLKSQCPSLMACEMTFPIRFIQSYWRKTKDGSKRIILGSPWLGKSFLAIVVFRSGEGAL